MNTDPRFIFVVCQQGAESAVKTELSTTHPELRLAFSRPGFLTFKVDEATKWPEKFTLKSTLARTSGWMLGKVQGTDANVLARDLIHPFLGATSTSTGVNDSHAQRLPPIRHLHVWERDALMPGEKGFEPGATELSSAIGELLATQFQEHRNPLSTEPKLKQVVNRIAKPDDCVLDVILVEPDQWWFGYHYATTVAGRWPGGVPLIPDETEPISRAYLKAAEALLWSGIEIKPGDVCAEIGSAPGGCCQLLLEKGATVIGIDPAEMDPSLLKNERFTHIRRRGNEIKKKDLASVKWLFADLNLVPNYTLDTVSEIVSNEHVQVKGMILTLKLADWKLLADLPAIRKRVESLGFKHIKTRQLAFNRQEFCLVAVRDKFMLRTIKRRPKGKKRNTSTE